MTEIWKERHITPDELLSRFTIHQLAVLGSPSGELTREQALVIINQKRDAKGLEPIHYLP